MVRESREPLKLTPLPRRLAVDAKREKFYALAANNHTSWGEHTIHNSFLIDLIPEGFYGNPLTGFSVQ